MATYISLPILDGLVRFAENDDSIHGDAVKAMASGILNYYFPPDNGFIVASERLNQDQDNDNNNNNNEKHGDSMILRIRRGLPDDRGGVIVDHAFVICGSEKDRKSCMMQLSSALEHH
ncbi:hypothetical protein VTN00DRAFT_8845 [Thermoascus crustaceus]|uniref:uncharacterized protein n=1 Tax=Thermoascus crustaceus TaxID=5088 RepID=UPI003743A407